MPLTILSNKNIQHLLLDLRKEDLHQMMERLREALDEYSLSKSEDSCSADNQPEPTSIESSNGTTTRFMPATSSSYLGMKVVTQATVTVPEQSSNESLDREPEDSMVSSPANNPRGAILIMSNTSEPIGIINAQEFTAFRTALTSSLLLLHRRKVKTLTVFGTGKQAFWHVRLALCLHGHTIKHVHFINRDFSENATFMMKSFYGYDALVREREGWPSTSFSLLTPYYEEYRRMLYKQVRDADVLYCTTPSTEPLFDHKILTETQGRQKGRLIIAVGSFKDSMIEVPKEVIHQAVKKHGTGHHLHKHAEEGGVIIVDTLACLTDTGELTQAKVGETEVVELGELVMLERLAPSAEESSSMSDEVSSPRSSLEGLSMRTIFSSSLSKTESPSEERHGLSHIFPSHRPHHLPAIFHRRKDSRSSEKDLQVTSPENSQPRRSECSISSPHPQPQCSDSLQSTDTSFSTSHTPPISHRSSSGISQTPTLSSNKQRKKTHKPQNAKEDDLCRWLTKGNVIYKSIGIGLVDLVIGTELIKMAREEGVGVTMQNF
ncbi:Delta(1)-pyrroline-2-carboxylate reductase [Lachnellula cervina]|uniref:Delta(1)-pyrroline-2-carboxylate reductase n=1 Tax=Lachnellula cervina TaxID=1316786 RepID=A0A7D8Z400_9HELO|nr:Delta(1)-pyrroline-2-carboxylate reductase [Lachnellula cervina]